MALPRVQLPFHAVVIDEANVAKDILYRVENAVSIGACDAGYLYVERPRSVDVLLVYQRGFHSAVRFDGEDFHRLPVLEFFSSFEAKTPRLRLCRTDLGQVLLMAVAFSNKASMRLLSSLGVIEEVFAKLEIDGKTALMLTRGGARTLVYCRGGAPSAVYFAEGVETPPVNQSVSDRVMQYSRAYPDVAVDVFVDLSSRLDPDAARPIRDLIEGRVGPTPFMLQVRHQGRTTERRLFQNGSASIGRDPANDIAIDHRSVSRKHCVVEQAKGAYVLRDAGSANGTLIDGIKVQNHPLQYGAKFVIGEFEVTFADPAQSASEETLKTVFVGAPAAGAAAGKKAQLLYNGTIFPLATPVVTLGKAQNADVRLSGLLMKPVQATIVREGQGYRLIGADTGRKVTLNGQRVDSKGADLQHGAAISIGGHQVVFVVEGEG